MKEEGKIKIGLGGVVVGIVIIALLVVIGYLLYKLGNNNGLNQAKSLNQTNILSESNENVLANNIKEKNSVEENIIETSEKYNKKEEKSSFGKIDSSKEWVYTKREGKNRKMPYINISSESAKVINEEIKEDYDRMEDESFGSFNYSYYENDNIISLVTKIGYENDCVDYYVYNINKETGNTVSNSELLYNRGMKKSEFLEKLGNACDKKLKEYESHATSEAMKDEAKLFDLGNRSSSIPMFLGQDGKIDVIINECTYAGAAYYSMIVDVE